MDKKAVISKYLDEQIIDLGQRTFQIPDTFVGRWVMSDDDYAARPDLVSKMMYETGMYGDIIAKLNGYGNPFEFSEDEMVILPETVEISKFFFKNNEKDEDDISKPVAKKKSEPRKPNEAVVGDTRFKIDASNRIVIY